MGALSEVTPLPQDNTPAPMLESVDFDTFGLVFLRYLTTVRHVGLGGGGDEGHFEDE